MSKYSNSNSLFHYTRNYESLMGIIRNGFLPNYCKEVMINGEIIGIPMVSFCDIPLTRAEIHRKNYGKFAIGLTKKWGVLNNINPLLYLGSNKIGKAVSNIISNSQNNRKYYIEKTKELPLPEGDELTSKHLEYLCKCLDSTTDEFMHNYIFAYTKMFENKNDNGDITINYNDNEWRYIISDTSKWLRSEKEYIQWRGTDKKPKSIFPSLSFNVSDIRYILVETEEEVLKLINSINKLKTIGGKILTVENEKFILMTKIMSVERLNDDF